MVCRKTAMSYWWGKWYIIIIWQQSQEYGYSYENVLWFQPRKFKHELNPFFNSKQLRLQHDLAKFLRIFNKKLRNNQNFKCNICHWIEMYKIKKNRSHKSVTSGVFEIESGQKKSKLLPFADAFLCAMSLLVSLRGRIHCWHSTTNIACYAEICYYTLWMKSKTIVQDSQLKPRDGRCVSQNDT